jgi:hypothetical protein
LRRLTSILTNSDEQFPDILSPELTTWGVGPTLTAVIIVLAVDGYGVQPVYFFLASIVFLLAVFLFSIRPISPLMQRGSLFWSKNYG